MIEVFFKRNGYFTLEDKETAKIYCKAQRLITLLEIKQRLGPGQ